MEPSPSFRPYLIDCWTHVPQAPALMQAPLCNQPWALGVVLGVTMARLAAG